MKRMMYIGKGLMSAAAALVLALVASCTMVEFTGSPVESFDDIQHVEKSHLTKIQFAVEWPKNMVEEEAPQYITVVMNRIQNSRAHYVYHLDKTGNILEEDLQPVPPVEEDAPAEEVTPVEEETLTEEETITEDGLPIVRNGFYSIAAVAVTDFDELVVPELQMFADSFFFSIRISVSGSSPWKIVHQVWNVRSFRYMALTNLGLHQQ